MNFFLSLYLSFCFQNVGKKTENFYFYFHYIKCYCVFRLFYVFNIMYVEFHIKRLRIFPCFMKLQSLILTIFYHIIGKICYEIVI